MALSCTLTAVRRSGGKTYVVFGRDVLEFGNDADALKWASQWDSAQDVARVLLARVALAKGLVPGGAGGAVNLTLTFDPVAASPVVIS